MAGVTAYDEEIRKANAQRKHVENNIETIDIFEADQKGGSRNSRRRGAGPEIQGTEGRSRPRFRLTLEQSRTQEQRRRDLSPYGGESQLCFQGATTLQRDDRVQHDPRQFDQELVRLGRELEGVLGGDAKEIIDKIRQHEIELRNRCRQNRGLQPNYREFWP